MEPRKLQSGAAGSPPAPEASPSVGYPTDGDPSTSAPAGLPGAYWFYQISEELRNLIDQAGLTPDDTDLTQVHAAVAALIAAAAGSPASQAEMEAALLTTVFSSPGRQQYHPSAAKAWVHFNGTGTVAINASYNVSSITDNGTGDYTANFTAPMSSANYCAVVSGHSTGINDFRFINLSQTAGGARVRNQNSAGVASEQDADICMIAVFGDL